MPLRPGLRTEWLLDEQVTFLNHGSFGAAPRAVFEAQNDWRRRVEAEPVELLARRGVQCLSAAKGVVGSWLGMRPEDFGLVTNATEGVNAVLQSLDLREGDELLATSHVYNAVRQAMRHTIVRAARGSAAGVEAAGKPERRPPAYREVELPLPIKSPEQIERLVLGALSDRTRLLVIDHVTSPTALVFPVEQIAARCARRGVDVLIDGAHAPGMLPLHVPRTGAAYYAGNLHKWACAPKGSGFLWVRPDRQANVHPATVSHGWGEGFSREFDWQGTRDVSAWLAVPRALEFMNELGWENVRAHNRAMAVWAGAMLCEKWGVEPISPADGRMLGSMVTVPLPPPLDRLTPPQVEGLQQRLYSEHRIEVPVVPWAGRTFVRPCCQVYNDANDYDRLARVVSALAT